MVSLVAAWLLEAEWKAPGRSQWTSAWFPFLSCFMHASYNKRLLTREGSPAFGDFAMACLCDEQKAVSASSINCANSKYSRCCNVQSELPLIFDAFCTRIVAHFLQVFQTFWASSYEVALGATFVASTFASPGIRTFLHSMSILIAVVTQTRVLSRAFFDSTLVWHASHISSFWRCHKHSDLASFWADCFELNFFSFLEASVSFRLDSALKNRTITLLLKQTLLKTIAAIVSD